jgi:hypothetical protein
MNHSIKHPCGAAILTRHQIYSMALFILTADCCLTADC